MGRGTRAAELPETERKGEAMREQLLWMCGPSTRFVGKHPYADILAANPLAPADSKITVSKRYRALTLKAIKDNPGISTNTLARMLQSLEPKMARSTVLRTVRALERNGQIRGLLDSSPRHGGRPRHLWYTA